MRRAVLISIQPKWCDLIVLRAKSLEIRKTKPKLETPFKCYIYCTKDRKGWFNFRTQERFDGKVIGEFMCYDVEAIDVPYPAYSDKLDKRIIEQSKVPYPALHKYAYHDTIYGWHISDLKIYDKPKELSEFYRECPGVDDAGLCYECEKAVGDEVDCGVHYELHLTRPPQSWCYVEEVQV